MRSVDSLWFRKEAELVSWQSLHSLFIFFISVQGLNWPTWKLSWCDRDSNGILFFHRSGIEYKRRIKKFCHRPNILNSSKRIRTWVTSITTTIWLKKFRAIDRGQRQRQFPGSGESRSFASPNIFNSSKREGGQSQRQGPGSGELRNRMKTDRTASRELNPNLNMPQILQNFTWRTPSTMSRHFCRILRGGHRQQRHVSNVAG